MAHVDPWHEGSAMGWSCNISHLFAIICVLGMKIEDNEPQLQTNFLGLIMQLFACLLPA